MKKLKKFLFAAFTVAILSCLLCQPAFAAISESDVQAQVDAVGKEAVSGNVFIWFLCAIGFLKVGQKIDSFLSSLGVNVGHTGGSMLAEAKLVVAIMSEGHFTSSGHFIVLRGVKDGKIMVADPASYTRSEQLWDLSIILNEASRRAGAGGPFWIIG